MSDFGQLERIEISGFKSIEHLDLEIKPLNVLIGANGAGKSNFIAFFKFVNNLVQKNLQFHVAQQLGADKILFFGRKRTNTVSFHLHSTPNSYVCELAPDAAGNLLFAKEICTFSRSAVGWSGGPTIMNLAAAGSKESGLPDVSSACDSPAKIHEFLACYLSRWKVYHFHDTSESAKLKQPCRIDDVDVLLPSAENLAAFLRSIRGKPEYNLIVRNIQRIAPFFRDFVLEPERDNPKLIRLRWAHRGTDNIFDASDFSDGTLRFICLTTLLLQPILPSTLLLDEPERGLHPYALNIVAGMLRSASSRAKIIVSTQSVTLANQFSWEDLIIVDRVNDASVYRRLSEQDVTAWLDDYAMGELWEKNIIGGTP